jgi:hypothetical protein
MLKIILIAVVAMHGIGHVLFLVPLFATDGWGQSTRSWLLGEDTPARLIGGALWLSVIVAFGAAVVGMIGGQAWWRVAAVVASVASLIGLALFWRSPASSSAVIAGVVNIAILIALLIAQWPPADVMGA